MTEMKISGFLMAVGWLALAEVGSAAGFGFEQIQARARDLAARPYEPGSNVVSAALAEISYTQHRDIRFRPEHSPWRGELPFFLEFVHPGAAQRNVVFMHEIQDGVERSIPFSTSLFDYGTNPPPAGPIPGFAGFRLFYSPENFGEVAAFVGASYFRMVGSKQNYGTSARGLALNTATAGPEEFPAFTDFWFVRPQRRDQELTLFALLNSTNAAGAYRFVVKPGLSTVARVDAVLFFRNPIERPGLAPLTSMFLHDENNHLPFRDYRPEVHDSDLLLLNGKSGEWFCRPLAGVKTVQVDDLNTGPLAGFGLLQRDRDFEHYQDFVGKFQRRPSVWITPGDHWPAGHVELIQLPSDIEFTDNVVALWRPDSIPAPGQPLSLSYQLEWAGRELSPRSLGQVRALRIGRVPRENGQPWNVRLVVDFGGEAMARLSNKITVEAEVKIGEGATFVADSVNRNEINGTWRLVIEMSEAQKPVQIKARLHRHDVSVSETFLFRYEP